MILRLTERERQLCGNSTLPVGSHGSSLSFFQSKVGANTARLRVITDPFDFHMPGSTQTVEFYGYGARLSEIEAVSCFKEALNDAIHRHHSASIPIGVDTLAYFSNDLVLSLTPRDTMTWKMWSDAVQNMVSFSLENVPREWQFLVLEEGFEGEVGYGALYWKSRQ